MCIHLGMNIQHEFIWSTSYCVPACLCAQHCIMRTRQVVRGDPTSLYSVLFCSPEVDQGDRGILPKVCAYSFSICRIQISQVCITRLCGPWDKVAYLHFIYSLCALHDYECNQIVFILNTSKSVFILSISSASFIQYRYSLIQLQLFLSSYLLTEFCSSPCTLHHSKYQRGSTRCGAQQQWSIVCVYVELLKTKDVQESVSLLVQIYFLFSVEGFVLQSKI